MLKLYIGPAGSGKTAAAMDEISARVQAGQPGSWLIVPEQYSHEAERELCRRCGDAMSRYAEVFSFTGLARRVLSEEGGAEQPLLDKGGRLLCMTLALDGVGARLSAYRDARRRPEFPALMLSAVDELKSACVGPEELEAAAAECDSRLGSKLRDAALVLGAYDAVVAAGRADPSDRLALLAEKLPACLGPDRHVFVDGFIDFTARERAILRAMLQSGAELTVCLTLDDLREGDEIFALSRRAAKLLRACSAELGVETETRVFEGGEGKAPALRFFTERLFRFTAEKWEGENGAISLHAAAGMAAECEFAAARALELVRGGCRWRDIAVAARGFEDYRPMLESVFRHYGVPLYLTRRSELLQKPLPALIAGACELLENGWDVDELLSYLRTGLTGLSGDECDTLANYVFKWQLRAPAWESRGDWRQHPDGYGVKVTAESEARLREINALRRRVAEPLLSLQRSGKAASTAAGQAAALARFFEDLKLPETLERRAGELNAAGQGRLAAEYRQLWELIVGALEQFEAILGKTEMDLPSFGRLFLQMLSQYDVGTIPVSLDRVSAGDFDRMRRRSIRHLIVLGAGDDRLPPAGEQGGLFSDDERERLYSLGIDLGGAGEEELWREFSLIYHVLTLPSESLDLCYSTTSADGAALNPAIVFNRAKALFGLPVLPVDAERCRLAAPGPALTLAANALRGGDAIQRAAAVWARETLPDRMAPLEAAAAMTRGRLSPAAAEALYGRAPRLTASRIDLFSSCRYSYFCQFGLKAQPYEPAGFSPPEMGSFLHFVLEHCVRDAQRRGGFDAVSDEELRELVRFYVEEYVHRELNDLQEKSARFVYVFRRLSRSAESIVLDTVRELRNSDFKPLDFELNFAKATDLPPLELGGGQSAANLTGVADRVDGWLHEGRLYLRIVDYKSGSKEFSLNDVWYGMGLQMLLYLFTLSEGGEKRYEHELVPAGVMYLPAREILVKADQRPDDETLEKARQNELRRSGLLLDDEALAAAWDKTADRRYIPLKFNRSKVVGGLASAERIGRLARHVKSCLSGMAKELRRGSIEAGPYYRSEQKNACAQCDYYAACQFSDGVNGESYCYQPKLTDEEVWARLEREEAEEHA